MSWRVEVLSALRVRFATTTGLSAWQVFYTNRENDVKPESTDQFIEEKVFPTSSVDTSIGYTVRYREIVGTWQVQLCVPVDSDVFPVLAFADLLERTMIASPALLMADGVTPIRISNVLVGEPRPARADDPWVRVPVVFTYTINVHT
jgi:Bacteriophage related domain of unknown function